MIIDTSAKHYLIGVDNDDTKIFRVLEIFRLFDLFETNLLGLTSPKLWDDPYENFLRHSYGISTEEENLRISYEGYSKFIFGQCWTLNDETDAIWRIYSPNRDRVKIKTSIKKLHGSLQKIQDKWFRSYLGKVKYVTEHEIKKKIANGIMESKKYFMIKNTLIRDFYFVKRNTFMYENEIRLIVNLSRPPENYKNAIYQDPDNLDVCILPLEDPTDLIDEIVFDPRMPNSLVRAYISHLRNEFNFSKPIYKSTIYMKPEIKQEVSLKI
jgi:hypothetical protein